MLPDEQHDNDEKDDDNDYEVSINREQIKRLTPTTWKDRMYRVALWVYQSVRDDFEIGLPVNLYCFECLGLECFAGIGYQRRSVGNPLR